jgi:hypothetical protein
MSRLKFTCKLSVFVLCACVILAFGCNAAQAANSAHNVSFSAKNAWLSGNYSVSISVSDATVASGESTSLTYQLTTNNVTLMVNLKDYSGFSVNNFSVSVNPLGLTNYSIPQVTYSNSKLANMSVILSVNGAITANIGSDGTLSASTIQWSNNTDQQVNVKAPSDAKDGDVLNISLDNIKYVLSAGIFVKNQNQTLTIIPLTHISNAAGSPSSESDSITVSNPPTTNVLLWIVVAVLAVACGIVGFMFFRAKKELNNLRQQSNEKQVSSNKPITILAPQPPTVKTIPSSGTTSVRCKICGTENRVGAKFCKKCGNKL